MRLAPRSHEPGALTRMRSDAIRPGDIIAGKYRVRAIMSRSRGFLVEAFHTEFDQRVVIRVLSPAMCDEKEVERFRREARTLAKLESEHVARILDVGTTPDGAFYFVRQYLEGVDLATHLKQRGAFSLGEAVLTVLQASEAVAETHVHNIILRELQPAHLFVTTRIGGSPQVKIIDFGTAKLMREAAAPTAGGELTATAMFGLSCYSSPELVRKAKHIDVRTDVWSLGAILYQLLTARPPFEGEMAALMLAISRDEPIPVTRYRRDVPAEIDTILNWALAKDVDGRFANVHGFAHALTPFASPEGQVLIQRIGQITTAGKQRRQNVAPTPAMDRDHPISIDNNDLLEDDVEDAPTNIPANQQYAAYNVAQAHAPAEETAPLERTVFIGSDFVPQSPSAHGGPAFKQPPPPAAGGGPMFAGAAAGIQMPSGRGSQPPPPPSLLGPPQPTYGTPAPSLGQWAANNGGAAPAFTSPGARANGIPQSALATIQSGNPGGAIASPASAPGSKPKPAGQKVALAAVASAVVLLSIVAAVVVIRGRPEGAVAEGSTVATASSAATTAATTAATPPPATEPAATAPPPTAEPPATATPAPPPPPVAPVATAKPVATVPGPMPTAAPKATHTATAAPPPPPAADSGGSGTLVAVAVGGTCAFSVDGASKGTTSTLKVQVKAGTHSVTCKPSTGATKSKSVTVASGGTAMAMFKL